MSGTFHTTQRMTGRGSDITVIEPSKYLQFFKEIKDNKTMDNDFRAFLALGVSGGCRVSETLALKAGSISPTGSFQVRVLKKRTVAPVFRTCQLCPMALQIVQEYIQERNLKKSDLLFKMHRTTVHRRMKKHFGPEACSHSITRHSHISWLLHSQKIHVAGVSAEMKILSHAIDYYNHANIADVQRKRFTDE